MKSEIESMYENQVWNLVDPPEGSKPIECQWNFKKKTDADGNVTVYEARLVAKGFRQHLIHGVLLENVMHILLLMYLNTFFLLNNL